MGRNGPMPCFRFHECEKLGPLDLKIQRPLVNVENKKRERGREMRWRGRERDETIGEGGREGGRGGRGEEEEMRQQEGEKERESM